MDTCIKLCEYVIHVRVSYMDQDPSSCGHFTSVNRATRNTLNNKPVLKNDRL